MFGVSEIMFDFIGNPDQSVYSLVIINVTESGVYNTTLIQFMAALFFFPAHLRLRFAHSFHVTGSVYPNVLVKLIIIYGEAKNVPNSFTLNSCSLQNGPQFWSLNRHVLK